MKHKTRNGILTETADGQDRILQLLYANAAGRLLLKPLTAPAISKCAGKLLSTSLSRVLIRPFIRKYGIDMSQYEEAEYGSYNDFFSRKIRPEMRPVDSDPRHLISPCDCKLTVFPVTPDCRFTVKHTEYTVASLLKNPEVAASYQNGWVLIFRLCVDDYHRYCYAVDGEKGDNIHIPGVLHTVNPLANDYFPIYKENTREYTVIHNEVFGDVVTIEVGALMVGKIVNHHRNASVLRGQEKGYFQFGGSTIVMLLKENTACIDRDILENSADGIETVVRFGEKIGSAL